MTPAIAHSLIALKSSPKFSTLGSQSPECLLRVACQTPDVADVHAGKALSKSGCRTSASLPCAANTYLRTCNDSMSALMPGHPKAMNFGCTRQAHCSHPEYAITVSTAADGSRAGIRGVDFTTHIYSPIEITAVHKIIRSQSRLSYCPCHGMVAVQLSDTLSAIG